tara:strand:- start:212 stop:406 length:195 start_codon:yes stop_codon:yes gene_type:complete
MFMDRLIELLENKIQEIQNPEVFKETEEIETEYNFLENPDRYDNNCNCFECRTNKLKIKSNNIT